MASTSSHKIMVIGAGQLGSRHLQALKLVKRPLDITVIDPSQDSLKVAKDRFEQIPGNGFPHKIEYATEIPQNDRQVDFAIVATSAKPRREILEVLLKRHQVSYMLLEKILFTGVNDYPDMGKLIKEAGCPAWVNFPMRLRESCKRINSDIHGEKILYSVSGTFGFITNVIHYLDHMVQLTGCADFTIDTTDLDETPIPSKRSGYLEMTGTLRAGFSNGSIGSFTCFKDGKNPPVIEIHTPTHRFIIRESEQKMWVASGKEDWKYKEEDSSFPTQSVLTADITESILAKGQCGLTTYDEASKTHLQLLEPLRKFLKYDHYPFT